METVNGRGLVLGHPFGETTAIGTVGGRRHARGTVPIAGTAEGRGQGTGETEAGTGAPPDGTAARREGTTAIGETGTGARDASEARGGTEARDGKGNAARPVGIAVLLAGTTEIGPTDTQTETDIGLLRTIVLLPYINNRANRRWIPKLRKRSGKQSWRR